MGSIIGQIILFSDMIFSLLNLNERCGKGLSYFYAKSVTSNFCSYAKAEV